ncbi:hypothetical protein KR222_010856, partial [Zaprionus bogoriensis]
KISIGQQVISNKKVIQQARAQTVAKLVQKLRKLKNALEKQPENAKHKERLRKNVECMAQLKSLKRADIMRSLLLQMGSNHNAVLTNGRATPEESAIAMLGLNKLMHGLLEKFQQTLKLSLDANAKWREEILETSKRRLKLQRTEEKRRKRKELKEQKAQERNRLEWLEQHNPKDEGEVSETPAQSAQAEKPAEAAVEQLNESEQSKQANKSVKERLQQPKAERKKQKVLKEKPVKPQPATVQKEKILKEKPIKPVQKENNHKAKQPLENNPAPARDTTTKSKKPREDKPTHVVDPFFITESGQPYLSTAVVNSDDSDSDSHGDDQAEQPEQRRRKPAAFGRQEKWDARASNPRRSANVDRLQQTAVQQNTKLKFGEDGVAKAAAPSAPAASTESEASMHPSWIAKQKLKPKIAVFAGTKIKFNDD